MTGIEASTFTRFCYNFALLASFYSDALLTPISLSNLVVAPHPPQLCKLRHIIIIIIIIIKRQFIGFSNIARVTTRAPYNVRCSYSAKQLVSEVGTREKMCLEHVFGS